MHFGYRLRDLGLSGYNPVNAGYEACSPSHSYGPTTRDHVLLHYIASGKGVFVRDGKRYNLSKGSCFIIRPQEVTYYEADENDPWHYIWVGFTSAEIPRFLLNDVIDASAAEEIFCELEEKLDLYNSAFGDGGVREAFVCGRIAEIMARLQIAAFGASLENSEMEIAKNYIDTNYGQEIKIGEIAGLFHFDSSYFSRAFKKHFGVSPQTYLVKKRLSEAAKLMQSYGFSPSAAANAVGYSDIYLFSKMFKRHYGIPPREYRKKG